MVLCKGSEFSVQELLVNPTAVNGNAEPIRPVTPRKYIFEQVPFLSCQSSFQIV